MLTNMKKGLVALALAATVSTTASAFVPNTPVKSLAGTAPQTGARFPLATK